MDGAKLFDGWGVSNWSEYILWAAVTSLLIRYLITTLAALAAHANQRHLQKLYSPPREKLSDLWLQRFYGGYIGSIKDERRGAEGPQSPDYWFNTLLGWFELVAFPIFIVTGAWAAIGAWLTLKTVAQWEAWKANRTTFNRFLIGTAALLFASWILAKVFVKPVACACLGL
jgi:hypothetical protein